MDRAVGGDARNDRCLLERNACDHHSRQLRRHARRPHHPAQQDRGKETGMSEWQPLETAPTDGRDILLWHLVRQCQYIGHYSSSWGWYISVRDDSVHFDQCLCWMPLPTKPENADKKLRE